MTITGSNGGSSRVRAIPADVDVGQSQQSGLSYVVGLIGRRIGSSRSPAIHEMQAREPGIPLETPLLAAARAAGLMAVNGIGMVVGQAADAFALMTGFAADRESMLLHITSATK